MSDNLETIYESLWNTTRDLTEGGEKPLAVAGVMLVQALTIYKTLLSPEEFDQMVAHITETKDQVKTLNLVGNTLQ